MAKNGPKTSYDYRQSSIHTHSIPIQITEEMLRNLRARARKWVFRPFGPPFWPILRPFLTPSWPKCLLLTSKWYHFLSIHVFRCPKMCQKPWISWNLMKSDKSWGTQKSLILRESIISTNSLGFRFSPLPFDPQNGPKSGSFMTVRYKDYTVSFNGFLDFPEIIGFCQNLSISNKSPDPMPQTRKQGIPKYTHFDPFLAPFSNHLDHVFSMFWSK